MISHIFQVSASHRIDFVFLWLRLIMLCHHYPCMSPDLNSREEESHQPVHVINVDIQDNHEEATLGAFLICELCQCVSVFFHQSVMNVMYVVAYQNKLRHRYVHEQCSKSRLDDQNASKQAESATKLFF